MNAPVGFVWKEVLGAHLFCSPVADCLTLLLAELPLASRVQLSGFSEGK